MEEAKNGDTVKVHYTGKLEDGTIFDSSANREPLQFKIGEGKIIEGFEKAVVGMNPGDEKTTKVSSDKAYGPHRNELVVAIPRKQFPEHLKPEVGQQLQMRQRDGRTSIVTVADVSESTVTIDANHPLAGKDLTFDIKLLDIV